MRTRRHLAVYFTPEGDAGGGQPQAGGSTQPQGGTQAGGQAPPAGNGQAPAGGTQQGSGAGNGAGGSGESAEEKAARLERELGEARSEAAGYRTKAKSAEGELEKLRTAGMSEAEKAEARRAAAEQENLQLRAQLRAQAVQGAALTAATKLNFRNPELAYRLLSAADLEFDEATGAPKGVERQLRELATAEPYLVKPTAGDFGGGTRGGSPDNEPSMNELMRAALRGS